jgi:hypothetical protein
MLSWLLTQYTGTGTYHKLNPVLWEFERETWGEGESELTGMARAFFKMVLPTPSPTPRGQAKCKKGTKFPTENSSCEIFQQFFEISNIEYFLCEDYIDKIASN